MSAAGRLRLRDSARQLKLLARDASWYRNVPEIAWSLLRRRAPRRVALRGGLALDVPESNNTLYLIREIMIDRVYTRGPFAIGPDDVVVDIGANVGVFTLHAASATRGKVVAVEAFPGNVDVLKRNVGANGFRHVEVVGAAVCGKSGTAALAVSPMSGMNWVYEGRSLGPADTHLDVPAVTLPELVERFALREIGFLKIDCEGAEGDIFRSTPPEVLRRVRKIGLEFHDNVSSLKHGEIEAHLRAAGFSTELEWDGRTPFGILRARRA